MSDTIIKIIIIIRWIFRKLEGVVGTGWSWLRIRDRWRALVSPHKNSVVTCIRRNMWELWSEVMDYQNSAFVGYL
jgi:hypothetical protein